MDRHRNLRSFAGNQFTRLASSSIGSTTVNRAHDLASKARVAMEQASGSSSPFSSNGQPQTWKEWALQKTRGPNIVGVETVHLFPGWATRRSQNRDAGFTLELYVSGFASSLRPPEQATRSQKAFMAIARRMAALPKLPPEAQGTHKSNQSSPTASVQDLLQSNEPPEQREAAEMQALQEELAEMPAELRPTLTRESTGSSATSSEPLPLDQLKRMHANLDMRLQPFWASSVTNRPVVLSIFCEHDQQKEQTAVDATSYSPLTPGRQPLFTIQTSTDAQGSFSQRISIPFETICTNPEGLGIAFEPFNTEPKLMVQAVLQPAPRPVQETGDYFEPPKQIATHISIPVSNQQIRVISDIDDTIKISDIVSGVKKVFNNVFVKGAEELIVPGMNTFYQRLHRSGVRFHYVSNSPYGLLPILTEFLQIAELPQGSLRLRFYGGRSLFGGLWEPAGERKRSGVTHVLDNFPESKFFLIGDTGEQDLDLYVELAKERPDQIAAIFLRDVVPLASSTTQQEEHLLATQFTDEPQAMPQTILSAPSLRSTTPSSGSGSNSPYGQRPPYSTYKSRSRSGTDPKGAIQQQPQQTPPMQMPTSFIDDEPMPGRIPWSQSSQEQANMTPAEKRRWQLDQKIAYSKQVLPAHIVFRVFRHAEELDEAFELIDRLTNWRSPRPSNPFA